MKSVQNLRFAVCLADDLPGLQRGKVYRVVRDRNASEIGWLRVIDDLEEDYLYPAKDFVFVKLPEDAQRCICSQAIEYAPASHYSENSRKSADKKTRQLRTKKLP